MQVLQPQSQVGAYTVTVTGLPEVVGATTGVVQSWTLQVADAPAVLGKHCVTVPVAVITSQTSCAPAAATRTTPDKAVKCLILPLSVKGCERVDGQNQYREVSDESSGPRGESPFLKGVGGCKSKCSSLITKEARGCAVDWARVNGSLNLNKRKGGIPAMLEACYAAASMLTRWNLSKACRTFWSDQGSIQPAHINELAGSSAGIDLAAFLLLQVEGLISEA